MFYNLIKAGVANLNDCYLRITEADADLVAEWLDDALDFEIYDAETMIKILQNLPADLHNMAFIYRGDAGSCEDQGLPADFDEALKIVEDEGQLVYLNKKNDGAILQLAKIF